MRKVIGLAIIVSFLLTGTAHAGLKWHGKNWTQCRVNKGGPAFSDKDVKRTIRCAVDHFAPTGGTPQALQIAQRESGLNEYAVSYTGCCKGIYQQHASYWSGRVADYNRKVKHWKRVDTNIFNARSNIMVSVRMASRLGWCPHWC